MSDNLTFKLTDNSKVVLEEFKRKCNRGLKAIGATAERYAKADCPVDTGRLRGSITYALKGEHSTGQYPATPSDYAARGIPAEGEVYIGTNVEYAEQMEFLSINHRVGKAHFLRDAATTHGNEFKKLLQASLEAG